MGQFSPGRACTNKCPEMRESMFPELYKWKGLVVGKGGKGGGQREKLGPQLPC